MESTVRQGHRDVCPYFPSQLLPLRTEIPILTQILVILYLTVKESVIEGLQAVRFGLGGHRIWRIVPIRMLLHHRLKHLSLDQHHTRSNPLHLHETLFYLCLLRVLWEHDIELHQETFELLNK